MCYYKLLKENSNGKSCKCYIKLAKRSEKREANDNFNQEKGFVEHIYIYSKEQTTQWYMKISSDNTKKNS